jgi:hypothetical protein
MQIHSVAVTADDVGSFLQPTIQLARTGRLVEIETRRADVKREINYV